MLEQIEKQTLEAVNTAVIEKEKELREKFAIQDMSEITLTSLPDKSVLVSHKTRGNLFIMHELELYTTLEPCGKVRVKIKQKIEPFH